METNKLELELDTKPGKASIVTPFREHLRQTISLLSKMPVVVV